MNAKPANAPDSINPPINPNIKKIRYGLKRPAKNFKSLKMIITSIDCCRFLQELFFRLHLKVFLQV